MVDIYRTLYGMPLADLFVAKMTKPKPTTATMHWVDGLKNPNNISKQDAVTIPKPRNMVGMVIPLLMSQRISTPNIMFMKMVVSFL